ncbi:ferredoxin family protein [Candidatus Bathyarchaeota archaeon]|nr:ferredoxin family protein [Candidatus Bathyarchaeota archaeon]
MTETYMGLPRREIPWFPTIDYNKCVGCLQCVETDRNAGHNVYAVEGNPPRPVVKNPYECVVGCQACAKICPQEAISFPSKEELKRILRELRKKHGYG